MATPPLSSFSVPSLSPHLQEPFRLTPRGAARSGQLGNLSRRRRRLSHLRQSPQGALDVRARTINGEMELAAARAVAGTIAEHELSADYVVPSVFNRTVAPAVATAVAEAAEATGVARRALHSPEEAVA